jgi:hypothetical protein
LSQIWAPLAFPRFVGVYQEIALSVFVLSFGPQKTGVLDAPQSSMAPQNGVAPFRSAMITGMYQTSIGAHHHRSGRGEHRVVLPDGVRPIPTLFQDAGCYTCIGSGLPGKDASGNPNTKSGLGKTDDNFD